MTREEFYRDVKAPALAKWKEGKEQTIDTFIEWWDSLGRARCSFCKYFDCYNTPCPLLNTCNEEWTAIDEALTHKPRKSKKLFKIFRENAATLYDRIEKIEYKEECGKTHVIIEGASPELVIETPDEIIRASRAD